MGTRILAQLDHLSAGYGATPVLRDLSLDIVAGRQLALLGPSGAGKSTLLRVLTGDIAPQSGTLSYPHGRPRSASVTQDSLLFDWLTVHENVALGLHFGANAAARPGRIEHYLDVVELGPLAESYPDELSGGQAQRAALARALVIEPDWLLLDEPFSALDPRIRTQLQHWLRDRVLSDGVTSVIVTHDVDEALIVADDIVVLDDRGNVRERLENPDGYRDRPHLNPLRSRIRAAYDPGPEADDELFSLTAEVARGA